MIEARAKALELAIAHRHVYHQDIPVLDVAEMFYLFLISTNPEWKNKHKEISDKLEAEELLFQAQNSAQVSHLFNPGRRKANRL